MHTLILTARLNAHSQRGQNNYKLLEKWRSKSLQGSNKYEVSAAYYTFHRECVFAAKRASKPVCTCTCQSTVPASGAIVRVLQLPQPLSGPSRGVVLRLLLVVGWLRSGGWIASGLTPSQSLSVGVGMTD